MRYPPGHRYRPHESSLITIGRDHLSLRPGPERPPGLHVDGVLDEPRRAVAEEDVDPAGVEAGGRRVGPPREAAPRLVEPAAAPGVLLGVGRDDRVEGAHPQAADRPPEAL